MRAKKKASKKPRPTRLKTAHGLPLYSNIVELAESFAVVDVHEVYEERVAEDPSYTLESAAVEVVDHEIYKYSTCGASLNLTKVKRRLKKPKEMTWSIHLKRIGDKMMFDLARELTSSKKKTIKTRDLNLVPVAHTQYLLIDRDTGESALSYDHFVDNCDAVENDPHVEKLYIAPPDTIQIVVKIKPLYEEVDGVVLGSIVEGVDHGTSDYELPFPFTRDDLFETLEKVEHQANEIWNLTHGCPHCGPRDEMGYIKINPDCTSCKGEGTII